MEKIPTAEEFLLQNNDKDFRLSMSGLNVSDMMIEFAKLYVEAALKYAVAVLDRNNDGDYIEHPTQERILNAYSLKNIK